MYIYESHLGGLYSSDEQLDFNDLYCEQCGDSDLLIGDVETKKQTIELLEDDYDNEYVKDFVAELYEEEAELFRLRRKRHLKEGLNKFNTYMKNLK